MAEGGEGVQINESIINKRDTFIEPLVQKATEPEIKLETTTVIDTQENKISPPVETSEPSLKNEAKKPAAEATPKPETVSQTLEQMKENDVVLKINPVKNIVNWIRYTPSTDRKILMDKVLGPAFATTIVSAVAIGVTASEPFINLATTYPDLPGKVLLGSLAVMVPSATAMFGGFGVGEYIKSREIKKRVPCGGLLTVSRVFTTEKSTLAPAYKTIDPQFKSGFTGELHLVGTNDESWSKLKSPLDVLREGAKGLFLLAVQCEKDDVNLKDITMFGGTSHIMDPQLEKYGFKIFAGDELGKKTLTNRALKVLKMLRKSPDMVYPTGVVDSDKEVRLGVISRQDLIKHKADFAKLAKIEAQKTLP